MDKKQSNTFRISPEAKRYLRELAYRRGISMAAVLELLIRDEVKRELKRQAAELARQQAARPRAGEGE